MATIVLQSCVKTKLPYRAKAADLYTSSLFKLSRQYARSLNPDYIFILSAKYGLVYPEQEIDPYDLTLKTMGVADRREWSRRVLSELLSVVLPGDRIIFLAGKDYREYLIPSLEKVGCIIDVPMKGLSYGKQLQWLKKHEGSDV
ncbi:MAG: hypothetical protein P1S60_05330 [Anaerolineae bacterium]|nr:hypothetical protein [Anaerolineae bacterium]